MHNHNMPLPSKAHWFQPQQIPNYTPPKTIHQNDLIGPASVQPPKNGSGKQSSGWRGCFFSKSNKISLFSSTAQGPGPSSYSIIQPIKKHQSKRGSFSKQNRFSFENQKQMGVGSYNIEKYKVISSLKKEATMQKAEKATFIDQAEYISNDLPGPGYYNPRLEKSKSVGFMIAGDHSIDPNNLSHKKKQKSPFRPSTNEIVGTTSSACSVAFRLPYRQSDQKMKQRLADLKRIKSLSCMAGPGKYLKIEQWGLFTKKRQISNGLAVCSKPKLRIYN